MSVKKTSFSTEVFSNEEGNKFYHSSSVVQGEAFIMRKFIFLSLFVICSEVISSTESKAIEGCFESEPEEERFVIRNESYRWPNGIVPYIMNLSESKQEAVRAAMDDIEQYTCIQFVEKNSSDTDDYIFIAKIGEGRCESNLGRQGGKQVLNLGMDSCFTRGHLLHELLHSLGFHHEHQRPDRDEYVTVNISNVHGFSTRAIDKNLGIVLDNGMDTLNLPYDFESVMHYQAYAGAEQIGNSPFLPTIKPNPNYSNVSLDDLGRGMKEGYLSHLDVQKINMIYDCWFS